MKIIIKNLSRAFMALTFVFAVSCGGSSGSETEEHIMEEAHEHEHEHSESLDVSMEVEGFTWVADENSMGMIEYKTDNVMMMKHGDNNVMMMSPKGDKASCLFKNKQGNVGVTVTIKLDGIDSDVKLIHHSIDKDNYEFVALKGNMMNLGRVEKGEEKILDAKEVQLPTGWFTLTVTAAGSHFKGYLNDKMMTHGHAQEMVPGYIGMSVSGNSKLSVKQVESTPLESEH